MKRFLASLCIWLALSLPALALESTGFQAKDHVTYFGTTDKEITVQWDANSPAPERYEVVLYHVERETEGPAGVGTTNTTSLTFRLPRSGHFVAKVRACEGELCGGWSESIDPEVAVVDGINRSWWLYGHVAPAGQITIGEGR